MIVELATTKARATPTVKKLVVKPSPLMQQKAQMATVANQQQIIVLPSNLILNSKMANGEQTIFRLASNPATCNAKVVLPSVRALKREAPAAAAAAAADEESDSPTRKRANLDHLTPEEKMMRRKLKNRVAAQNARDKKRVRMDEMEIKMKEMEAEHARILAENASLKALNARLMEENSLMSQSTKATEVKIEGHPPPCAPLTPPPSEAGCPVSPASSSESDYSLVDSRSFESAELICDSRQKSQDRGLAGLWTAIMMTMAPKAFCLAAAAAAATTASSTGLTTKTPSSTWNSYSSQAPHQLLSSPLPLKKRQMPSRRVPMNIAALSVQPP